MGSGFFPKGYEAPIGSSASFYLNKFPKKGKTTVRILAKPVFGNMFWITLKDGKRAAVRRRMNDEIDPSELGVDQEGKPERINHFWAMPVWNYDEGRVQIMEVKQSTIQRAITAYDDDKNWGDPRKYDIQIEMDGGGKSYNVIAIPPNKLPSELGIYCKEYIGHLDMEKLYDGGDPFEGIPGALQTPPQVAVPSSLASNAEPVSEDDIPF